MKRKAESPMLDGSITKYPRKTSDAYIMEINTSCAIPNDVIKHNLLPYCPIKFIFISREYNHLAIRYIISNPRCPYNHNKLLMNYIKYNNAEVIEKILQFSKSINPSANKNEAIREAILSDNSKIIDLLLNHREFDVNIWIEDWHTYLQERCTGERELYEFPILSYTIIKNRPNVTRHLLFNYRDIFDPAEQYNLPIRLAAETKNWELVKLLLQFPRVDPSTMDDVPEPIRWNCPYSSGLNQPFSEAVFSGNLEMVDFLMNDKRFVPQYLGQALYAAVFNNHVTLVKLLLDAFKVNPCECNSNVLAVASENGNAEIVLQLLSNPNIKNKRDYITQALDLACDKGYDDIVLILLNDTNVDLSNTIKLIMKYCSQTLKAEIASMLCSYLSNYK